MRIGEFSSKTGLSVDTLRYYEEIGLLCPSRQNNQRRYGAQEIYQVRLIDFLKKAGFTLQETKKLLALDRRIDEVISKGASPGSLLLEGRELLQKKAQEIEERRKAYEEADKTIQHLQQKIDKFLDGKI